MRKGIPALILAMALALAFNGLCAAPLQRTNSLSWNVSENRVSAEITGWDVKKLLQEVAAITSWQIFLEPETEYRVSTKFKNRTPGEALGMLLGNLSFALLPQTNGPSKLFVFRTTLQEATQLIRPLAPKTDLTAKPIPTELVVMLKPGAKIDELAKKLGAKVIGSVNGMNAYRLSFESAEAASAARDLLKDNSDVLSVGSNYYMQRPDSPDGLTFSSGFPFDLRPRSQSQGQGPIVGLIDTAIQATGTPLDSFLLQAINVTGSDAKTPDNSPTHGTAMLETVLRGLSLGGNESGVQILPVDVYGNSASTTTFDVAHGIVEAVSRGASVVNLSLGSSGDSEFLREVITKYSDQGVLFFAAAGNEPGKQETYPAAYSQVIAVTAGTRDGAIAEYANSGEFVDLVAPGSSIVPFKGQQWLITGTSASTAYSSGLAASLTDTKKLSKTEVIEALKALLPVKK